MGAHPLNLALRFLIEVGGLLFVGSWAWNRAAPDLRVLAAAVAITGGFLLWALFGVPADPTRVGRELVTVAGPTRLIVEVIFFTAALAAAHRVAGRRLAAAFATAVAVHYAASFDRIRWILGF